MLAIRQVVKVDKVRWVPGLRPGLMDRKGFGGYDERLSVSATQPCLLLVLLGSEAKAMNEAGRVDGKAAGHARQTAPHSVGPLSVGLWLGLGPTISVRAHAHF